MPPLAARPVSLVVAALSLLGPGCEGSVGVPDGGPGGSDGGALDAPERSDAPRPDAGPASCPELDHLTAHGITWTFASPVPTGAFADGTPFVVGDVEIVDIDPPSLSNGVDGRRRNGSMLDPAHPLVPAGGRYQGFDSGTNFWSYDDIYNAGLDVALSATTPRTLILGAGHSLVSSISHDEVHHGEGGMGGTGQSQLRNVAVLTAVSECIDGGWLRPAPFGPAPHRPTRHVDDVRWERLLALTPGSEPPSAPDVLREVRGYWYDPPVGWGNRMLHPNDDTADRQMQDYGEGIAAAGGRALAFANAAVPGVSDAERRAIAVHLIQKGLDIADAIRALDGRYEGLGGHGNGRLGLVCFAGHMLEDEVALAVCGESTPWTCAARSASRFSERDQTFVVATTGASEIQCGEGGYTAAEVGMPEWRFSAEAAPDIGWETNDYRRCCTTRSLWGHALVLERMGLRERVGHDAFFDYQRRYLETETERGGGWLWSEPWAYRTYVANLP